MRILNNLILYLVAHKIFWQPVYQVSPFYILNKLDLIFSNHRIFYNKNLLRAKGFEFGLIVREILFNTQLLNLSDSHVFGLTTDPQNLTSLRRVRHEHLGGATGEYAKINYVAGN